MLIVLGLFSDRMILLIEGKDYAVGTFKDLEALNDPKAKAFFKQ